VSDLILRLLASPIDTELSSRELAELVAYLRQPISLSQIQAEKRHERATAGRSPTLEKRGHLAAILRFNRELEKADPQPASRPRSTRRGRPSKRDRSARELVIAALTEHHKYEEDSSIGNHDPATTGRLAELAGVSKSTVSVVLGELFGDSGNGYRRYQVACRNETLGQRITVWRGETCRLARLFDEERGQRSDE